ncbi:MAG: TonB family protein [Neisseria sp.]|nr:TonB family protein [Neisseria sp.]
MNIRRTLSTLLTLSLLAGAQSAVADDVVFYQKASDARAPISGNVAMRLTLSPEGQTSDVRVIRSSGSTQIDQLAVIWMQQQTMRPVTKNNQPVEFSFVKEIKFSDAAAVQLSMK